VDGTSPEGPIKRILQEAGAADLVDVLAEQLAPTDLQTLLLEVYRRRSTRISPADLLTRYEDNRFTRSSHLDPVATAAFEHMAWSLLPHGYQGLELSPLCPLGTNSVVATVDQNKVVSTVRNTEVVADSTNVLALECAIRRRHLLAHPGSRFDRVCLVTSQRQVRGQAFGGPSEWAHFRILGMAAAGRDQGSFSFESEALCQQIAYLMTVVNRARPDWQVQLALTDLGGRLDILESAVLAPLSRRFPHGTFRMDPDRDSGRGYYVDACYKIFATDTSDTTVELADGGCTSWTRQLLSDDKERLVIGGLGVDRLLA
jgi:hypothetical protein